MGCGSSSDDLIGMANAERSRNAAHHEEVASSSYMPSQIPTIIVTPPSVLPKGDKKVMLLHPNTAVKAADTGGGNSGIHSSSRSSTNSSSGGRKRVGSGAESLNRVNPLNSVNSNNGGDVKSTPTSPMSSNRQPASFPTQPTTTQPTTTTTNAQPLSSTASTSPPSLEIEDSVSPAIRIEASVTCDDESTKAPPERRLKSRSSDESTTTTTSNVMVNMDRPASITAKPSLASSPSTSLTVQKAIQAANRINNAASGPKHIIRVQQIGAPESPSVKPRELGPEPVSSNELDRSRDCVRDCDDDDPDEAFRFHENDRENLKIEGADFAAIEEEKSSRRPGASHADPLAEDVLSLRHVTSSMIKEGGTTTTSSPMPPNSGRKEGP